ncbi:T9SS type A sorting domain-containing protein [Cryomorpha ignava]|uniref:T9SS type A sorting domain-containing protein n=1 Tax=Cryomorpha ignava TaxID=101383 RepID=A0A7K3WVU2_9FLAO|nr:lamin tail domain-containing protein [Cryomorpha ignava]NEN25052.1 T9SS type A sorting domain-containing protein [Cryomorpha ignava]
MKPLYKLLTLAVAITFLCTNAFSQCEPFFGKLVINEFMPANTSTAADPNGEFDDWVEIYNSSDQAINMEGYFLSDNHGDRTKYVFPDVVIDADGFLIVWCDGEIEQEGLHTSFRLGASGEELGLYNPDSTSLDYVRFGPTPDDITVGRYPSGHGPFVRLIPSFNDHNTNSVNLGLVINEYQAINESTAQDQWGGYEDWVEIYNNSDEPIDMTGYFLSDKIGDPTLFVFPDTIIEPDSYLIVWCDMGLQEPGLHTFFKLGSDGDDLLLSNSDTLTVDYVRFGTQIPDDSEGRFDNGTGPIVCMIPTFSEYNGDATFVSEINAVADFKLYPNPARNFVRIELVEKDVQDIQIYGIDGRLVNTLKVNGGSADLNLSGFDPGIYILRSETYSTKLIVY